MKLCLSNRQSRDYLLKANEISFPYFEKDRIELMSEKYPNADMVLVYSKIAYKTDIDWEEMIDLKNLTKNHLILALDDIGLCQTAVENEIPFFYNQKVSTLLDAKKLVEMGSLYIIPGEPLFFQMTILKRNQIPIRIIPNLVLLNPFLHKDGVLGAWIRPEDMFAYKEYISCLEFYTADAENPLAKERALYRLYIKGEEWPEELSLLITGLNYQGNNGLIDSKDSLMRMDCGQKCLYKIRCNICHTMLDIANVELLESAIKEEN